MRWTEPRQVLLGSLLDIAENSLSVLHLAETRLQFIDPSTNVQDAKAWLTSNGFDAAPLVEPTPHRYVSVQDDVSVGRLVGDVASPLDPRRLASSSLGLADAVALLADEPFYFVLEGQELMGVVTRADLQRPSVSMVTLAMILAAESRMGELIIGWLGPGRAEYLSEGRSQKATEVLRDRQRGNADLALIDCLMLNDRLDLIGKSPALVAALGYDAQAFQGWKKELRSLRDTLAHGLSLLDAVENPVDAVTTFNAVRRFAEVVWEAPLTPVPRP